LLTRLLELIYSERGVVTVLVAIAISVLIGCTALVTDAGLIFMNESRISNTLDSAVLAGAQELPDDPQGALDIAAEYAEANGMSAGEYLFELGDNDTSISATATRQVSMHLAKVLGIESKDVHASCKARVAPITGVSGIVPWGVADGDYEFGQRVMLKMGAGLGNYHGYFGALRIGGNGGNNYRNNIKYGYDGVIEIGDEIRVEPGNMSGPTSEGVAYRIDSCHHTPQCNVNSYAAGCPRICIVPLGVYDDGNGSNRIFTVTGFGAFLIDEYAGQGTESEVYGWFIEYTIPGIIGEGGTDHGVYGIQLCE